MVEIVILLIVMDLLMTLKVKMIMVKMEAVAQFIHNLQQSGFQIALSQKIGLQMAEALELPKTQIHILKIPVF